MAVGDDIIAAGVGVEQPPGEGEEVRGVECVRLDSTQSGPESVESLMLTVGSFATVKVWFAVKIADDVFGKRSRSARRFVGGSLGRPRRS